MPVSAWVMLVVGVVLLWGGSLFFIWKAAQGRGFSYRAPDAGGKSVSG